MSTFAVERRLTEIGIVLALYPSDPSTNIEIERAPDSAGSPDTGNSETIAIVPSGQETYKDLVTGTWHYRIRQVRDGATASSWTDWVGVTGVPIPDQLPPIPDVGGWIIKQGKLESTDGSIILDAPNEAIRIGAATSPTSGVGIYQGRDGVNADKYDWRVGDPNAHQAWWDHSEGVFKYTGLLEANGIRYGPLHSDGTNRSTGSTSETTLESYTVPGGAMGSAGTMRVTVWGEIQDTNNATYTLRIKFSTLLVGFYQPTMDSTNRFFRVDAFVSNAGGASSQNYGYSTWDESGALTVNGATSGGGGAINTASDITVDITGQLTSTGGGLNDLRVLSTVAELISGSP